MKLRIANNLPCSRRRGTQEIPCLLRRPHIGRRREANGLGFGTGFAGAALNPARRRISLRACFSLISERVCATRSEAFRFASMSRFP
jgi:hypothetical protein